MQRVLYALRANQFPVFPAKHFSAASRQVSTGQPPVSTTCRVTRGTAAIPSAVLPSGEGSPGRNHSTVEIARAVLVLLDHRARALCWRHIERRGDQAGQGQPRAISTVEWFLPGLPSPDW